MAGAVLRIELDDARAKAALAAALSRAEDLSPAWAEIGASLVTSTQLRFERGVSPDGVPWLPSLRALAEGGKTLQKSGRLMQSVTYRAGSDHVEVGTNTAYAAPNQFGAVIRAKAAPWLVFKVGDRWSRKKEVTLPARPFLGLDDDDRAEIVDILANHLLGGVA